MLKRILALVLVLSLLPMIPLAQAAEPSLEKSIAAQYDAYAASIRQADMDDNAIDQLLYPAIYGNGNAVSFDESDAITACLYGTALFRTWFIDAISYAVRSIAQSYTSRTLIRGGVNWATYAYQYGISEYIYNETPKLDDDMLYRTYKKNESRSISANNSDGALALVVGGSNVALRLNQTAISYDSVTYRVDVHWSDTFDFNNTYDKAAGKGYNTTLSKLITAMGVFLRLKTFAWSSVSGFSITVPNPCTHSGGGSFYWENTGTELVSHPRDGESDNPLTKHVRNVSTDTSPRYFYTLQDSIELLPSNPWSVEFCCKTTGTFYIGPTEKYGYFRLAGIYKSSTAVNGVLYERYRGISPTTGKEGNLTRRHYYHLDYVEQGISKKGKKIFRIENRIAEDGSNMLWLFVDGQEMGPLNQHSAYTSADKTTTEFAPDHDWINGVAISVRYIYNHNWPFTTTLPDWVRIDTAGGVQASREIAASCSQGSGTETRCMLCGATRLDITGKPSGHTPKTVPGIGATCQSEGLSDGSVCADCGEVLQVQTVLPKTPHTELPVKGQAPTCTGEGTTEGLVCALCNDVLKQQSSIPPLGHAFEKGFCARCGEADPDWILPGDANGDGVANYSDALIVLRSSIGLEEVAPNVVAACDMNSDGQLNYSDALIILRRSIGLE